MSSRRVRYLLARPGATLESTYQLVADSSELLELAEPFQVKLPISEITP